MCTGYVAEEEDDRQACKAAGVQALTPNGADETVLRKQKEYVELEQSIEVGHSFRLFAMGRC